MTEKIPTSSPGLAITPVKPAATVTIPTNDTFDVLFRIAKVAAAANLNGKMSAQLSEAQAMFIILKGYALGIDPIEAICQIYIVDGKPAVSTQVMIAMANRSGLIKSLKIPDTGQVRAEGKATVTVIRKDRDDVYSGTFTREEAAAANLLGKNNWKYYEAQMLINRAASIVLRRAVPEAISGMYPIEELAPDVQVDPETGTPLRGTPLVITTPGPNDKTPESPTEIIDPSPQPQPSAHSPTRHWGEDEANKNELRKLLNSLGYGSSGDFAKVIAQVEPGKVKVTESTLSKEQYFKRIREIAAQRAQPKNGSPEAPAEAWSDDKEAVLKTNIWNRFNREDSDFLAALGKKSWREFENPADAWRHVHAAVISQKWAMVADSAVYNGSYIEFQTPIPVRHYSREKLKPLVGEEYFAEYGIGDWQAREEPYEIGSLIVSWERKGKGDSSYLIVKAAAPLVTDTSFADDDDANDPDVLLDKYFPR